MSSNQNGSMSHNGHGQEPRKESHEVDWERLANSWREVGDQVQDLFGRIANAFRQSWSEEQPISRPGGIEDLRGAADRLERVVRQVADQTEQEREAAKEATRQASGRSMEEARSAAISGLRILNTQITRLLRSMEQESGGEHRQEPPRQLPPSGEQE